MHRSKFIEGTSVVLKAGTGRHCMLAGHRTVVQRDARGLYVTCLDGPTHYFTDAELTPFDKLWLDFDPA